MKKFLGKLKKIHYFHYVNVLITFGFLALTVFVFGNVFIRFKESFIDLWNSLCFYVVELFELNYTVIPTVNEFSIVPMKPLFGLPETWEEFVVLWDKYWALWSTTENVQAYTLYLAEVLYNVSRILLLVVVPLVFILIISFRRYLSKQNNDYDIDSKFLVIYKRITKKVFIPIKRFILSYVDFNKQYSLYFKIWLFIWAVNFNLIVILIEFIAYYLYLVVSFDLINVYRQFYKLFCDLTVMFNFVPGIVWLVICFVIFNAVRKSIGYKTLNHMEAKNCGFINERPIVTMVCATMGKKKTTMITDMALSEEVILRDKAFEKILENDLKFPNFPWVNFENFLKNAIQNHFIYNLATIRKLIRHVTFLYEFTSDDKATLKSVKRRLKRFGLDYDKPFFNYDYARYGLYYNDNLKLVHISEVLEIYAQLYFIYVMESSIILSNYSVRTDGIKQDIGNFPLRNDDFFRKDARYIDALSRHAKIMDFDMLRLGRKVLEDNPKKDTFEFGVVLITEVGKERKNNLTLQEVKVKEIFANQKNDGFNDSLKMIRHSATVDNYPFVKIITDEQRPESWGADARDLCEIVFIKESSTTRLAMPFFALTELVYGFFSNKFNNLYYEYRFNRADNTLFLYLIKKAFSALHNYYVRIYNTFGYCALNVSVENGTQDGEKKDKRYFLMHKKIYSKRFSTDCFSDFYYKRALRSSLGIEDLEEYKTEKATLFELETQNSYFMNDLMNKHNIDKE